MTRHACGRHGADVQPDFRSVPNDGAVEHMADERNNAVLIHHARIITGESGSWRAIVVETQLLVQELLYINNGAAN